MVIYLTPSREGVFILSKISDEALCIDIKYILEYYLSSKRIDIKGSPRGSSPEKTATSRPEGSPIYNASRGSQAFGWGGWHLTWNTDPLVGTSVLSDRELKSETSSFSLLLQLENGH